MQEGTAGPPLLKLRTDPLNSRAGRYTTRQSSQSREDQTLRLGPANGFGEAYIPLDESFEFLRRTTLINEVTPTGEDRLKPNYKRHFTKMTSPTYPWYSIRGTEPQTL